MGGVTDKLVQIAETAARGELVAALALLEGIRARHVQAASEMLNETAAAAFAAELDARLAEATALAHRFAAQKIGIARHSTRRCSPSASCSPAFWWLRPSTPSEFPPPTPTPAS